MSDRHSLFGTAPTVIESPCQNIDVLEKYERLKGHVVRGLMRFKGWEVEKQWWTRVGVVA